MEMAKSTLNKFLPMLDVRRRKLELKGLPVMFHNLYSFDELIINGNPYLAIQVKGKDGGPRQFKKHGKILSEKINYPQIWCMHELHFHKIQRLIQNGINFIIEDKQVHLPSVNISIKKENTSVRFDQTKLNGLGINILIREILKGELSGKNKLELAKLFDVTQMTMGRAIEPLITNEFCYEKKAGVSKFIYFNDREDLWNSFKKIVNSPVKEILYIDKIPNNLPYSGISALSKMTMLGDDEIPTFAMSKKRFKSKFNTVLKEFSKAKIELWDREPMIIKKGSINPIDIYLIQKDDEDERVQIELEKLLKEHDLVIP